MKELFELFKDALIKYPSYQGFVCGYNDYHFILAVESESTKFFDTISPDTYIAPEYTHIKYRYIYEDECGILKQLGNAINYQRASFQV